MFFNGKRVHCWVNCLASVYDARDYLSRHRCIVARCGQMVYTLLHREAENTLRIHNLSSAREISLQMIPILLLDKWTSKLYSPPFNFYLIIESTAYKTSGFHRSNRLNRLKCLIKTLKLTFQYTNATFLG